jgi:hypothetical protein
MILNRKRLAALSIALIVTAACGKKDNATVADTAAVAPPAAQALRVTEIETGKGWNTDRTLRDGTDDFGVRDTVYVRVKTDGASAGATLAAKWTYQDGQTVEESSQTISPTGGEAVHEFHIQKATAWPTGNYKVEIMLDGVSAGSKEFEIK